MNVRLGSNFKSILSLTLVDVKLVLLKVKQPMTQKIASPVSEDR